MDAGWGEGYNRWVSEVSGRHSSLWRSAFDHPDHLANGLCPDEPGKGSPGPDSRDPYCFYCNVLGLAEQFEAVERRADWLRVQLDGTIEDAEAHFRNR